MSRFIFSNHRIENPMGRGAGKVLFTPEAQLCVYNKNNFENKNYYSEAQDWIIGVGTYIYRHKTGEDALRMILDSFDPARLSGFKKTIKGIFSFMIFKNGCCFCFNDYYGLYDTYYGSIKDYIFVGTNMADIVPLLDPLIINEFPFIMHCFASGNSSNEGIFKGVWKLMGNEFLKISDGHIDKIDIIEDDYRLDIPKYEGKEQALNYLISEIDETVSDISSCFGDSSLCITGGLDSRLILASLTHNSSCLKRLVYGESSSFHLYTCNEDKECGFELSRITGIPLKVLNWTSPEYLNGMDIEWQKKLFSDVGFYNYIYCGNKNFTETITANNSTKFIEFGYYLEAIRMREWLEKKDSTTFSIDEYLDLNYSWIRKLGYNNVDDFIKWMKMVFMKKTQYLHIQDYSKISYDLAAETEWVFRERTTDSHVHQFINYYMYAFPIFSIPQIHEFVVKLPSEIIKKAKFQIELIRKLNPSLLNATVFSHRRKYRINNRGEKVLEFNLKSFLTVMGKTMPGVYRKLLPYYQRRKYHNSPSSNNAFLQELDRMDKTMLSFLDLSNFQGDISKLFELRQLLVFLELEGVINSK